MVKKIVPIFLVAVVILVGFLWQGLRSESPDDSLDIDSREIYKEAQRPESVPEVISTDTPGVEDITAATIKLPPAMEPTLSETWLNFLRNHEEAELEEDTIIAHGEYQKALEDFAEAYTDCISRKANPEWILRAKSHFGVDVDSRVLKSLKKGIVLWGVEKAESCRNSPKELVIGKEEELLVLMKANFEMAKKFNFDLEDEDKTTFKPYLDYMNLVASYKEGPVKAMLGDTTTDVKKRHIEPPIYEFIEGELEFQTPFDYAEALEQVDDGFGEGS